MGFEQGRDEGDGKTNHIEITALDAGDPAGGAALDGVCARLVHGFAGGYIGLDLAVGEG